jgi:hypothetical protein
MKPTPARSSRTSEQYSDKSLATRGFLHARRGQPRGRLALSKSQSRAAPPSCLRWAWKRRTRRCRSERKGVGRKERGRRRTSHLTSFIPIRSSLRSPLQMMEVAARLDNGVFSFTRKANISGGRWRTVRAQLLLQLPSKMYTQSRLRVGIFVACRRISIAPTRV